MMIIHFDVLLKEFQNMLSNATIQVFLWAVVGDIVVGTIKGFYIRNGNSSQGLLGAVKHLLVVCLVLIAYPYLKILGFQTIATGFVVYYIAVYGLSIIENFGALGVPYPTWLKTHLTKLREDNNIREENLKQIEEEKKLAQQEKEKKED